jgi:hypothetical protein
MQVGGIALAIILFAVGRSAQAAPHILVDPEVAPEKRELLVQDLKQMESRPFAAGGSSWFARAFGGTGSAAVAGYLDLRVHYVLSETADIKSKLEIIPGLGLVNTAQNVGTSLWLMQVADPLTQRRLRVGDTLVPLDDPRMGVIQLGPAFTDDLSSVHRSATLVHEARHSDCTGGLLKEDLATVKKGKQPPHPACGHFHVVCPAGHDLAGFSACDNHAWGAYAVAGLYTAAIGESCAGCSEEDIQSGLAASVESFSRVLVLKNLLQGKLGAPDMSSTPQVVSAPVPAGNGHSDDGVHPWSGNNLSGWEPGPNGGTP